MKLKQVAVQLYTLRDFLKEPAQIAESLKKVAEIGYRAVQISGMGPIPEEELVKITDDLGLKICATHEPSQEIIDNPGKVIEHLKKLGTKYTAYPHPHLPLTLENVKALAKGLNQSGKALYEEGLVLTYHNHQHEFAKIDGKRVLDIIYDETNPKYLQAELDTYWCQFGGAENTQYIRKNLKDRLPLLHLKDYHVRRDETNNASIVEFTEIGNGNLPFKEIIAAAEKAGTKWFIVEQDTCPGCPFESLAASFKYIKKNLV